MNEIKHIGGGLISDESDTRDFSFASVFGQTVVPLEDFVVAEPLSILDQYSSDLCTSFSTCAVSEMQEKVPLAPEYTFMKTKYLMGSWQGWGAGLRDAAKSHTKFGALKKRDCPFSLAEHGRDFVANHENWPINLDKLAAVHKKKAYFSIDGTGNLFEDIRSALWLNRQDKQSVFTGCIWRPFWLRAKSGIITNETQNGGFGHSFAFIGQKIINSKPYLVVQLSNGTDIGDRGLFYFPENVILREFKFGAFSFRDIPSNETKESIIEKSRMFRAGFLKKGWLIAKKFFFLYEK